jgi:excisionase family DNA binding protein
VPTVQRWVDAGALRAWKTPGGHRRVDADDADRLFEGRVAALSEVTGSPRVIVVDDNPDDRELLAAIVQEVWPSARIEVHDNGIAALVGLGRSASEILITDIVMPYMNGIEMLRQLDSRCVVRPRLIVAVTSMSARQLARLGGLPEGVKLVHKPVEPELLMQLLRASAGFDSEQRG